MATRSKSPSLAPRAEHERLANTIRERFRQSVPESVPEYQPTVLGPMQPMLLLESLLMWKGVLFDGDDTLWYTEPLYDAARLKARATVESIGLDGHQWEHLERTIDVENVGRFGHNMHRFPTSCVEAYEVLCRTDARPVDAAVAAAVEQAARSVYMEAAPLVPGACEVLTSLRAEGLRLGLLTKGERRVQERRIAHSELAPLFDAVAIVSDKSPTAIRRMVNRLGVPSSSVLFVGNSLRSDILPALAAGIQPVWIDAHVWEYERQHDTPPNTGIIELNALGDLPAVVNGLVLQ